jgi:hypothetical protein
VHAREEVEDIGEVSAARAMAMRVAAVAEIVGAARAVQQALAEGLTLLSADRRVQASFAN